MRLGSKCLLLVLILFLGGCKIFRKQRTLVQSPQQKAVSIARSYTGVPYRFGGNNYEGIDCSGLIFNTFKEMGIVLPRVSWQQAERGQQVGIEQLQAGDLVFFITQKEGKNINHSGIVTEVRDTNEVYFIHAGSKGVREENIFLNYWRTAFAKAVRVL